MKLIIENFQRDEKFKEISFYNWKFIDISLGHKMIIVFNALAKIIKIFFHEKQPPINILKEFFVSSF